MIVMMLFLDFFEEIIYCKGVTGFHWLLASVWGMVIDNVWGNGERYSTAQNFGGFGAARKLVEKILADHINASSLFELIRTYTFDR